MVCYPYRLKRKHIAFVAALIGAGILIFFVRSVGMGLLLYLSAGIYAVGYYFYSTFLKF